MTINVYKVGNGVRLLSVPEHANDKDISKPWYVTHVWSGGKVLGVTNQEQPTTSHEQAMKLELIPISADQVIPWKEQQMTTFKVGDRVRFVNYRTPLDGKLATVQAGPERDGSYLVMTDDGKSYGPLTRYLEKVENGLKELSALKEDHHPLVDDDAKQLSELRKLYEAHMEKSHMEKHEAGHMHYIHPPGEMVKPVNFPPGSPYAGSIQDNAKMDLLVDLGMIIGLVSEYEDDDAYTITETIKRAIQYVKSHG